MPANTHLLHLTKTQEKAIINKICAVFAVFMPLTTAPQIFMLYTTQNASGLSLAMWLLYSVGVVPFLLFGILYRHKQLVVLNSLWLLVQVVMIVGIVIYR